MNDPKYAAYRVKGKEDTLLIIANNFGHAAQIFKNIMLQSGLDPSGFISRIDFIDWIANSPFPGFNPANHEWLIGKNIAHSFTEGSEIK